MYICLTENQKQYIEQRTGKQIIEVKRLCYKIIKGMKPVIETLIEVFWRLVDGIKYVAKCASEAFESIKQLFAESATKMPPVEIYRFVKFLSKCGFDEREITIRTCCVRLARSNC